MDRAQNGSNSWERRHFSPQQKVAIVKAHLVDGVPISDLCDRHHIQPAQFYLWQKQLLENGATAFERKTKAAGFSRLPCLPHADDRAHDQATNAAAALSSVR
jgi:transposase-like protein